MGKMLGIALALGISFVSLAGPRLAVDQQVYDFGEVVEGMLVRHAFVLRNIGDEVLHFTRQPATTCGCTSAPLERLRLEPGEAIELVAQFDSTHYGGRHVTHHVYVYSNDPVAQRLILTIQGYVQPAAPHEGSAATLYERYYLLIDLRSPEDYRQGHLLGAINIPFSELSGWLSRLPKDVMVYLYDETGVQAVQAAEMLQQNGFLVVRAIAGGLVGWWQELGDLFFQWASSTVRTAPAGNPYYGRYSIFPRHLASDYVVVVDLRPEEAYQRGHLPGAVNVSPVDLSTWAAGLPRGGSIPSGAKLSIWLVDEDGTIACQAAQFLWASGFPDARCVIGGLGQWRIRYGDGLIWPEPS